MKQNLQLGVSGASPARVLSNTHVAGLWRGGGTSVGTTHFSERAATYYAVVLRGRAVPVRSARLFAPTCPNLTPPQAGPGTAPSPPEARAPSPPPCPRPPRARPSPAADPGRPGRTATMSRAGPAAGPPQAQPRPVYSGPGGRPGPDPPKTRSPHRPIPPPWLAQAHSCTYPLSAPCHMYPAHRHPGTCGEQKRPPAPSHNLQICKPRPGHHRRNLAPASDRSKTYLGPSVPVPALSRQVVAVRSGKSARFGGFLTGSRSKNPFDETSRTKVL